MTIFSVSCLITTIVAFIAAIFIYVYNPQRFVNIVCSVLNVNIGLWALGLGMMSISQYKPVAVLWLDIHYIGAIFIPVLFLHFICAMLDIQLNKKILYAFYGVSALFYVLFLAGLLCDAVPKLSFNYYTDAKLFYPLYTLVFWVIVLYTYYIIIGNYGKVSSIVRNQLNYLILASIINYVAGISAFLPVFNIPIYPYGMFLVPIYSIILAYTITKARLMDISVVINRITAWLSTVAFLGSIYLCLVWLYRAYVSTRIGWLFLAWTILYGILVGETFLRIRLFIQTAADKKFIKGWYDYRIVQRKLADKLRNVADKGDLLPIIQSVLDDELEIKDVRLDFDGFKDIKEVTHLSQESVLPKGLAVPCIAGDKLEAVILVGPKRTEEAFNDMDIDLFRTLADEVLIVLQRIKPLEKAKADLVVAEERTKTAEEIADKAQEVAETIAQQAAYATLTRGIAHEIRNPLGMMLNRAEIVAKNPNDEAGVLKFADMIKRNTLRLTHITETMLKYGKATAKEKKELDINSVLDEFFLLAEWELNNKGIKLIKNYGELPKIIADPVVLYQAFSNIVLNSIDAMKGGGTMTATTFAAGGKISISIEDTGCGIAPENIKKLFDPFFTTKHEGTGLGLSIAYRNIVEQHHGEINIESEVGKVTKVNIVLPLR